MPRLTLADGERERVLRIIHTAMNTRPNLTAPVVATSRFDR